MLQINCPWYLKYYDFFLSFFLSSFLGWWIPNLFTEVSGWCTVNKTTCQNLWPRIHLNSRINWNRAKRGFKTWFLFLWRQPQFFENVTWVARRRKRSWVSLAIILFGQLLPKRGVFVHKNSLVSCQRCRHSVEPRAPTCSFKQNNLSAW